MAANNFPIVLAHGIARFDFLLQRLSGHLGVLGQGLANDGLHYFKGIARHLRTNGFDVYQSSVSFAGSVEHRAADLKREIDLALALRPGLAKVHIIAHSMGGLDARHAILNHGLEPQVASLTTIGTPHLGTSFADWGVAHQGHHALEILGNVIDLAGAADLTTTACQAFNNAARNYEATNSVFYQTYASSDNREQVFTPLQQSWQIIYDAEGANDGLVSRASQHWESQLVASDGTRKDIPQHDFPVAADHLNQLGWWDLNQLKLHDMWQANPLSVVSKYEGSIRDIYLAIAKQAQILPTQ